jgi:CNT family concentrative nucleoside transporter
MLILQSLFGFFVLLFIAWLLSENRRHVPWRFLLVGVGMQFLLALLLLKVPWLQQALSLLNHGVLALQQATENGSRFVFGYLAGGDAPFATPYPQNSFILAFRALPLVIVMSALTALLTYWRILPKIIQWLALALNKSLGISGSLGLGTAANVFIGMVEAPLLIRPWLQHMSRSELFALMSTGMATIAGTMLALYATILGDVLPNAIGHLLAASFISVPAALVISRLMVPETCQTNASEKSAKKPMDQIDIPQTARSSMDALTQGTQTGLQLFLNIIAMLIVLLALVHLVNSLLALLPLIDGKAVSLQGLLGYLMAPIVWLMGIPWQEATVAGSLMGVKTALNEFLAYIQLSQLPAESLTERSRLIMTYALCGFANFGSLGILLAGMTTLMPERRDDVLALGMRSIVAGTLATCCTGAVIGVLY